MFTKVAMRITERTIPEPKRSNQMSKHHEQVHHLFNPIYEKSKIIKYIVSFCASVSIGSCPRKWVYIFPYPEGDVASRSILQRVLFYLMFIPVNSLLFYVVLDNTVLLYVALASAALIAGIYLKFRPVSATRRRFVRVYRTGKRDVMRLVLRYLRINRNFIIGSGVGLFLATGILTQAVVVSTSYQQYAFDNYIQNSDVSAYQYSFKRISKSSVLDWNDRYFPDLVDTFGEQGITVTRSLSYGMVEYQMILAEIRDSFARYLNTQTIKTRQWTPEFYEMLSQLPTFPDLKFEQIESLLVVPDKLYFPAPEFGTIERSPSDSITRVGNRSTYQVLLERAFKEGEDITNTSVPFNNVTVSVSTVWEVKAEDWVYIRSNNIRMNEELLKGTHFLPAGGEWELYDLFEERKTDYVEFPHVWGTLWAEGLIWVDIPLLSDVEITDFEVLLADTVEMLYEKTVTFRHIAIPLGIDPVGIFAYSPLDLLIQDYLNYDQNLQRIMIMFSAPMIVVSLFFYFFAISITQKRKIEIFYKMKIRGASTRVFLIIMLMETLAYGVISAVVGLVGGVTSSGFAMSVASAVEGGGLIPLVLPISIYWKLPVVGSLLAFLFNMSGMFEASLISFSTIGNLEKEGSSVVTSSNFDLYTFGFAMTYWLVIPLIEIPADFSVLVYQQLGFVAILATIMSLPFMGNRFYFPLLKRLSGRFSDDIVHLSLTSILHYRKYTTKFFALMLITLFFAFQGMISTSTIVTSNQEVTDYTIGADMYVQGLNSWVPERYERVFVDGVKSASPVSQMVYKANLVERLPGQDADSVLTYNLMGVDPSTFPSTAFWKEDYATSPLEEVLAGITRGSLNIALDSQTMRVLELKEGDTLVIRYGYRSQESVRLNITASFDYFPRLVSKDMSGASHRSELTDVYVVGDLDTMEVLSDAFSRGLNYGTLLKLLPGADIKQVTRDIYAQYLDEEYVVISRLNFRGSVFSMADDLSPLAKFEEYFILSSLTTTLLISIAIGILGTVYYAYVLTKTRKKDFGIFKAVGMVRDQLMRYLLSEILILSFSALFFSFLTAMFLTGPLFTILLGGARGSAPPLRIIIPWTQIGVFVLVQGVLAVGMAAIPALRISKQSTANIVEGL